MSLIDARADIVTALNTVEGVTGYARRPTTLKPGAAFPRFAGAARGPGMSFAMTWNVVVIVPQSEAAASDWLDSRAELIAAALDPVGYVDSFVPVKLETGDGDLHAIQFVMREE